MFSEHSAIKLEINTRTIPGKSSSTWKPKNINNLLVKKKKKDTSRKIFKILELNICLSYICGLLLKQC